MDNLEPLISIIVPVYNVEQYLKRCIDSLIYQTYQNIEILLIDDGSPDCCGEICDEYARMDNRIVVVHKPNGGLSDARNKGLDIAKGEYVMFVDSDDWIELNTCQELVRIAVEEDADLISFGVKNVYDNGVVEECPVSLKGAQSTKECIKALIYKIKEYGVFNFACNKIFHKSLLCNFNFTTGRLAEDQGTTYKLFHIAKNPYICDKFYYNYYQRVGSISHNQYYPRLIIDRHLFWMERLVFIKKYYPELEKLQTAQILGDIFVAQIKLKGNSNYKIFRDEIVTWANSLKSQERELSKYNKKIKLHFYCYPLFYLYVRFVLK